MAQKDIQGEAKAKSVKSRITEEGTACRISLLQCYLSLCAQLKSLLIFSSLEVPDVGLGQGSGAVRSSRLETWRDREF